MIDVITVIILLIIDPYIIMLIIVPLLVYDTNLKLDGL